MLTKNEKKLSYIFTIIQITHILDFVVMMPLGPILIRQFGISPAEFAYLVSSYNLSAGLVSLSVGNWIDLVERKKFLLLSYVGFIVATAMCAFSYSFSMLLVARVVAGAFGGLTNAAIFAFIGDQIREEARGEATGIVMSAFSIASVAGVPLGLFLATSFYWEMSFILIVVLSVSVLIISLWTLPKIHPARENSSTFFQTLLLYKKMILGKFESLGLLLMCLVSTSSFILIPFISPFVVKNLNFQEVDLKYIYLFGGVATLLTSRLIGRWCDQFGSIKVYIYCSLLSAIPAVLLTNLESNNKTLILIITTLFMVFFSGRFIPVMSLMNSIPDKKHRGTFLSMSHGIRTLCLALAAWIGGLIIHVDPVSQKIVGYNINGWLCLIMIGMSILVLRRFIRLSKV